MPEKVGRRRSAIAFWDGLTESFGGSLMSNLLIGVPGVIGGKFTVGYN
jgi:hypothetical protein